MTGKPRRALSLPAEEEFGVFGLIVVLLRRWRLLVGLPVGAAVAALAVSLLMPRTYTAQVVFAPEVPSPRLALPSLPGAGPGAADALLGSLLGSSLSGQSLLGEGVLGAGLVGQDLIDEALTEGLLAGNRSGEGALGRALSDQGLLSHGLAAAAELGLAGAVELAGASASLAAGLGPWRDDGPAFYAELLRTRTVVNQVLNGRFPDPRAPAGDSTRTLIDLLGASGASPAERLAEGRLLLEDATSVQFDPVTRFVTLTVAARDPQLAAAVADRFTEVLDRANGEMRRSKAGLRRRFLEERIRAAEAELAANEEDLQRFIESNRQFDASPPLRIEHARLERQVHIKQAVLAHLHREIEHARLQELNDVPVLTTIDPPAVPAEASSPTVVLNILLALVAGAVLAVLLIVARELRSRAGRSTAAPRRRSAGIRWAPAPERLRPLRSAAFWAGVLIALPIFIRVGSGGIGLAPSYGDATGSLTILPASALTIPGFLLLLVLAGHRTRLRLFQEDLLVALYIALLAASALAGAILNESPAVPGASGLAVARFGQAVFPLAGYFLARMIILPGPDGRASTARLSAFISGLMLTILIALAGYLLQTGLGRASAFRFSILADHIGPFYNYKMKRFFPSYVAIASLACLAYYLYAGGRRSRRLLAVAAFLLAGGALALMWSRTALLMWLAGVGFLLAFAAFVRHGRVTRRVAAILLLVAVGTAFGSFLMYRLQTESPRLIRTAIVLISGFEDLGRGDVTRFERMSDGVRVGFGRPLGDMHRIYVAGPQGRDLLESENGYLDFAVRAGPIAFLAVLALFLLGSVRSFRFAWRARTDGHSSSSRWAAFAFASILLSIVLVGNVWLNLATEPYFAPLVWFLVGTAPALRERAGGASSRQSLVFQLPEGRHSGI